MLLRHDLRICNGEVSGREPQHSYRPGNLQPPNPEAEWWLCVHVFDRAEKSTTFYEVWRNTHTANNYTIRRARDGKFAVGPVYEEADLVHLINTMHAAYLRSPSSKPAAHLTPRSLIFTPRSVIEVEDILDGPRPDKPSQYAKWWGWVRLASPSGGYDPYAVWTHSLRTDFYYIHACHGEPGVQRYARGVKADDLDDLLNHIESLQKELNNTMDITYTLTEAEVEQACRNYIIDRTNVKPGNITSVSIITMFGDRPEKPDTTTARISVKHHTPEVK